jgi:hypothetical protein
MNQTEAYITLFSMLVAIANIFFLIFKTNYAVISSFSFAMSLAVLYFSYKELIILDFVQHIRSIIFMGMLDKNISKAFNDSRKVLKDAKNPFK